MRIERPNTLTFHKWNEKDKSIKVTITDPAVKDKPNQFGGKDNYFRGVIAGTEDAIQVPMPYDLLKKFEDVEESIEYGVTTFTIAFVGTKPMKGKAPMKLFDVDVDGLKGDAAPSAGAAPKGSEEDIPF